MLQIIYQLLLYNNKKLNIENIQKCKLIQSSTECIYTKIC